MAILDYGWSAVPYILFIAAVWLAAKLLLKHSQQIFQALNRAGRYCWNSLNSKTWFRCRLLRKHDWQLWEHGTDQYDRLSWGVLNCRLCDAFMDIQP